MKKPFPYLDDTDSAFLLSVCEENNLTAPEITRLLIKQFIEVFDRQSFQELLDKHIVDARSYHPLEDIFTDENDYRHGKLNGYNAGCRCARCRETNREQSKKRRAERKPLAENDSRHGTFNGYGNWKCRCAACRLAWSIRNKEYASRKKKSNGN